ncbi:hypothetical protein MMC31_002315 [Peltigera leucophlebia]|nr:hypothetical protein [Peltigera leucophlebia]
MSPFTEGAARPWYTRSHSSTRSRAEEAIARDLEEVTEDDLPNPFDNEFPYESALGPSVTCPGARPLGRKSLSTMSLVKSYRRPSFTAASSRPSAVTTLSNSRQTPTNWERYEARREEQSLLRDNHLLSPKHPQTGAPTIIHGKDIRRVPSDAGQQEASDNNVLENTRLLGHPESPYGDQDMPENIDQTWEEAVMAGKIRTTWQRESKVLLRYASPLVLACVLQYSLSAAIIFCVGYLGKVELGAVSLGNMTANIIGYAVYQGLATSLDTLCPQAYGSGRKKLVGLQAQRMVYFLWCITIPIGIIWLSAGSILIRIVPEPDVAVLASRYLKITLIGAPGYAFFESGKRYFQAQGLFSASLYILLTCAPLNILMNWLFVWQFKWGFIGAPIAVAITNLLLPILLILHVRFIAGRACWPGLTTRAFRNWGPMVWLALPGLVMVEAEWVAFEIFTLVSSYFGTSYLAAQSVLVTITGFAWQIPFPFSIAAGTRVANLIGATLLDAAKTAAKVSAVAALAVGLFNAMLISLLRGYLPRLFTQDPEVIRLVVGVLPLCAAFQLFDSAAASTNGILRGLGRQKIGGLVQIFCYYAVAMLISMGTVFGLNWGLFGLWSGLALALGL